MMWIIKCAYIIVYLNRMIDVNIVKGICKSKKFEIKLN